MTGRYTPGSNRCPAHYEADSECASLHWYVWYTHIFLHFVPNDLLHLP